MIRVVDVECTDMEGEVIEIAWTDVHAVEDEFWRVGDTTSMLCDPVCLIEFGAMAVHHITDDMVKGQPLLTDILRDHAVLTDPSIQAFAAHNASYELARLASYLPLPSKPWVCTWKVSHHLAPKLKAHSNQAMRYALRLELDAERAMPPHRAGPDSYVTAHLLVRALSKLPLETMLDVTNRPVFLQWMPIGKQRGEPFENVDTGFLNWIVNTITDNEDLVYTARRHLVARKQK